MVWSQIEATPAHVAYLTLSTFLIGYTLFTWFIRNRLHLSEPPLALLFGILLGPRILGWLTPNLYGVDGPDSKFAGDPELGGWGWGDNVVQEATRVIVGIQVFAIGVELPKFYFNRHWKSVAILLGPVMSFGWLICALFVWWIFMTDIPTALIVAACLTPTDPVLAASILSNSQFSTRVPKRIKDMLSAESGCNDGTSFPFLYAGLFILRNAHAGPAIKEWFLITILWQCAFGLLLGLVIGTASNRILRFSDERGYIDEPAFKVFYLLLALLSVGAASILGVDDFLVAFGCGYGFARDGWFSEKTKNTQLPLIIDLMFNSAMFVYFGTIIPWYAFEPHEATPWITPGRLILFLALVLLFRRIPIVLALYKWIPDIRTFREALFCGHFGPMGLGGLFLAIEARAVLETGSSLPLKHPPRFGYPYTSKEVAIETVWPVVCFVVFGSTLVHGLSTLVLSIIGHFSRPKDERASLLAAEDDPLDGMVHDYRGSEDEDEEAGHL
ncbi:Sodium/hydrogen exchanger [Polychaeton citri CBS 116435]|uniref:Sodium/hydrogen exchanger n=1 Tax=Polychaeton citri CBS 116435 TaxID=1314669 RepID=A0A9P4UNC3_9PEZI|nr:Sodium/hydrogen exchanger [Polychaeton citri CBS 116435]